MFKAPIDNHSRIVSRYFISESIAPKRHSGETFRFPANVNTNISPKTNCL